jgi:hypothetical protein
MSVLTESSIVAWIAENEIKNEKGDRIEFGDHLFLYDIYRDNSRQLCVTKPAQVGLSTLQILKNHFDAKREKLDIIYTLPTDNDVNTFVSGKVNRIIANNPCMLEDVADKDSIEQKQIGNSYEYFRGTWTKKAAIMITADRLVHDEIDSSKLSVIADFPARLQHSKHKQIHVFSHPSVPNKGVDQYWKLSDQKEWFITCPHCQRQQFLSWNTEEPSKMSIDIAREVFVCKKCGGEIDDDTRAVGRWVPRTFAIQPEWSGYHISLLMAPWVSAKEIVAKHREVLEGKQTMDFFYNKVLGLPYSGSGNTVEEETIMSLITAEANEYSSRMIIGVDTGVALRYVVGNKQGLVGFGQMKDYMPDSVNGLAINETLEYWLQKFPNSIMVIDQGGDIIGSRKLRQKYPGRVYLCHYARDRKTMQLMRWGESDESGNVLVDRNRMLQLLIDEAKDKRFKLYNGSRSDWHDYWLHWSHIYRVWEEDSMGVPRFVWMRDGRDDWVHATLYWRVGISRFGGSGSIVGVAPQAEPNSYMLNADGSASFDPGELFKIGVFATEDEDEEDWRI